ncbi:2-hydroxy-3-oxopropionate reductase [Denitratisoma sp. DHT3]|uniref:NAD(P)-dependent oxidoreductase n=1 Tax=Denitratisoma sp. DHT3 TaxID=1981880 RepID=UPI001198A7C4|nr:NAD(P)-dependent oxidoreductase [Denitratisoma sp. DHT3]QDX80022.1 2-hydroxy-3-oxopropionate reductase [Denitratisoma sp. DHT3]
MNLGFIGLGLMGRPMALNLARAGHALRLWARRPESLAPFAGLRSVTVHDSPAAVARASDLVITIVADAPDVRQVTLGPAGIAEGGRAGLTVVDMSTIPPGAAREIGGALAALGIDFLDAPVSGGEKGAIAATLTVMAGGTASAFARAEPVLRCLGRSVTHVGACGAGQVAKACNQIITGVTVAAVAEAFNLARASGVDPARVRQALLGGSAASSILENHGLRMLERDFQPGFKAWMHQKDLRIVMEEAHRLGLLSPTAAAAAQMFNGLVGCGEGESDSVAVLKLLERLSGHDA